MTVKRFPKDLIAELCEEMPDFEGIISYHGKHLCRASQADIASLIDVCISSHNGEISGGIFDKKRKKNSIISKREERLKELKEKVLNLF
ncbi:MAG TPA: hypothetical protein P5089_01815 [Candidatus Portnoybacteria bacterium]|nr:hypothetical protein [Candidatus Portnoybacteria bacterium]